VKEANRIIGVDESGKGDFFGPLVIAGCLAAKSQVGQLSELGVRDSKLIAEKKLLSIDTKLREEFVHSVLVISPEEYNSRYKEVKNLNKLLAYGHARCIQLILEKETAELAVSDKFGKEERLIKALAAIDCSIPLKQIIRGEAIPQVAAASIIARAEFVRQMSDLSIKYGIDLPKGAAPQVDEAGRCFVTKHGHELLTKVSKTHFKNYKRALDLSLSL